MRFGRSTKWVVNIGFGAVMVALTGIGVLSFLSIRELTATAERVVNTQTVLAGLDEVNTMVTDALRGERGFVITGDPIYLRPYMDARERLPGQVREVARLTSGNSRQQKRLQTFRRQIDESMVLLERVIVVRRGSGFDAAQALLQSTDVNGKVEAASATIRDMENEERALLNARTARADASTRRVTAMVLLSSVATLLFLAMAGYVLNQDIDAQQAAAAALRRSREEFQALVEASGSFIVATDPDLRVTVFNREAERLSGLRREDVVGGGLADAFGAQAGFGAFEGLLRRAMDGQAVKDFDAPLQDVEGYGP